MIRDQNGNPLVVSDGKGKDFSRIIEVNPENGKGIYEADTGDALTYRTFRGNLYTVQPGEYSRHSSRLVDTTTIDPVENAVMVLQPLHKRLAGYGLWIRGGLG
jgi:hypothetical protein